MAKKTGVGTALGFLNFIMTAIMAGVKSREEVDEIAALPVETLKRLIDQFVQSLIVAVKMVKNIFPINIGGNRTTEQVVAAGNYSYSNSWITSKNFPMRPRQGKREVILVDMPGDFTLVDALAKLTELGLEQPVYEDGLFFGEQHPEKQREAPIMFPHEPVPDSDGYLSVVFLWSSGGGRRLALSLTGSRWFSNVRVAGVRKLPA